MGNGRGPLDMDAARAARDAERDQDTATQADGSATEAEGTFDHELGDMNTSVESDTIIAAAGDPCDPKTFDASDPKYAGLVNPRCEQQGEGATSSWALVCD